MPRRALQRKTSRKPWRRKKAERFFRVPQQQSQPLSPHKPLRSLSRERSRVRDHVRTRSDRRTELEGQRVTREIFKLEPSPGRECCDF